MNASEPASAKRKHHVPTGRLTSRDVAALAGVSQATVSRVLTGSDLVKGSTRLAVLKALEETGYVANASARTMRIGRTGAIGVVGRELAHPFYLQLLDALSGAIHAAGHRMILWDGRLDGEVDAVVAIRQQLVDSVIFTTATETSEPLKEALKRELPVVLVHRTLNGVPCASVTADNVASARHVARYLVEAGRKSIAMINGLAGSQLADDRLRGFTKGLQEATKKRARPVEVSVDWTYEAAADGFGALLRRGVTPDALFCANDVMAYGAMDAARAAGFRVPDDLWVVGHDDLPMSKWGAYDLTTVRQPLDRMAEIAVAMALDRQANPGNSPKRRRLATEFIVRGSTAHTSPTR